MTRVWQALHLKQRKIWHAAWMAKIRVTSNYAYAALVREGMERRHLFIPLSPASKGFLQRKSLRPSFAMRMFLLLKIAYPTGHCWLHQIPVRRAKALTAGVAKELAGSSYAFCKLLLRLPAFLHAAWNFCLILVIIVGEAHGLHSRPLSLCLRPFKYGTFNSLWAALWQIYRGWF